MSKRIPSLDGVRALSVGLVILFHLHPGPLPVLWRVSYGLLGVRVFFVISGFLITKLLLAERNRHGRIDLKSFYARRFIRIAPAYCTFLLVMAIVSLTGALIVKGVYFAYAAFYLTDLLRAPGTLGHTWSLSVEEQFYLLWPLTLSVLGPRRAGACCLGLVCIAPVLRLVESFGHMPSLFAVSISVDAIATGCLLAICGPRLERIPLYRRVVGSSLALFVAAGPILLMAICHSRVVSAFGLSALNFGIAIVLDRYMKYNVTMGGAVLNSRVLVWIGTMSYSLYLWQQPFMYNTAHLQMVWKIAGSLACAAVSYYFIERPFIALRTRLRDTVQRRVSVSA
jgi:peptidoglycan/LPS O-acetylase OafA/YrhL